MAHVVFLKGANVGGNNVFRPKLFAESLSHLDVLNVGAAGTFVVRAKTTSSAIRRDFLAKLPFQPVIALASASEITEFIRSAPFGARPRAKGVRWWVGVLAGKPKEKPRFPIATPVGRAWSVRVDGIQGSFAFGHWRRQPGGFVIPNIVVEKAVGVPVTVRWWETFERIAKALES